LRPFFSGTESLTSSSDFFFPEADLFGFSFFSTTFFPFAAGFNLVLGLASLASGSSDESSSSRSLSSFSAFFGLVTFLSGFLASLSTSSPLPFLFLALLSTADPLALALPFLAEDLLPATGSSSVGPFSI